MRMKLKNNNSSKFNFKFIYKYFNTKSFFVFIISLFIVAIILGAIYFSYLNINYKESIFLSLKDSFSFTSYKYLDVFKENLISNVFNSTIIWILGISVIGVVLLLFILFAEGFGFGIYIAASISKYSMKGIILSLCYLFSGRIIYMLLLIFLIYKSVLFSYKLVKFLFFKKDIDIKKEFSRYFKVLVFSVIVSLCYSIIITFVSPFIYKVFTFFIK